MEGDSKKKLRPRPLKRQAAGSVKKALTFMKKKEAEKDTKKTPGKAKQSSSAKAKTATPAEGRKRGTIYIGHLPHGFYEDQLRGYFSQFGIVTGVNVPRSDKTGNPKGYAYVQFLRRKVAEIAVETMHNYLMCNRVLVCILLTARQASKVKFPRAPPITPETCLKALGRKRFLEKTNGVKSKEAHDFMVERMTKKLKATQDMLTELGIPNLEIDFWPYNKPTM